MNTTTKGLLTGALITLFGCTTTQPDIDKAAVEDFVEVRGLEEAGSIRTTAGDSWKDINEYHLIYRARKGKYLVAFGRRCRELRQREVTPDHRWDHNQIRAGFDTIRGCRIDKIYGLSEIDAQEILQLGEAPGSGN